MKRILAVALLGLTSFVVQAQYIPNNSQGYQFMSMFNPAFSGVENFGDLKLSYRYQWAGFQGAPKFINFAYTGRLKQPVDYSFNSLRVSNASAANARAVPKMKGMIYGFGVNLFQYQDAILNSIGGSFSFSVNYPLTEKIRVAGGALALVENRKLNINEINTADPDPFLEHLKKSGTTQTDLNLRAGFLMYGDNFYAGISYLPLLNIAVQSSDLAMEKPFYRGSFQLGYAFPASKEIELRPSMLGLMAIDNSFEIDYNLKAVIQNKVIAGLSYRDIKAGVLLLGFNLNEKFTVTYSYEMSFGNFQKFNDGSHELVLSGRLKNLRKYNQYIW
jgi:type IX secretion system PorP/SprF family membrane protein